MGLKIISNDKSFYGNFETRGILRRFLNPLYFTEVLKLMVFNKGSDRLSCSLKKPGEHVPHGWFSEGNCNLG